MQGYFKAIKRQPILHLALFIAGWLLGTFIIGPRCFGQDHHGEVVKARTTNNSALQREIDDLKENVKRKESIIAESDKFISDLQDQLKAANSRVKASEVLRANQSNIPPIDITGLEQAFRAVGTTYAGENTSTPHVQWRLYTSPGCRPCHQRQTQLIHFLRGKQYKISANVQESPHILVVSISEEEWAKQQWTLPRFELYVNGVSVFVVNGDQITNQQLLDRWDSEYNAANVAMKQNWPESGQLMGIKVGNLPIKPQAEKLLQSLGPFLDGGTLTLTYTPKPGVVKDYIAINQGNVGIRIPAKTSITFSMDKYTLSGKFSDPPPQVRIPVRGNTNVKSATLSPSKFAVQLSYMLDPEWILTNPVTSEFFGAAEAPVEIPQHELDESVQPDDFLETFGEPRSGHWPTVRKAFVKLNPTCAACGGKDELNVHHVKPFHTDPSLELDPSNLITLCRKCHFNIGHLRDWKNSNPNVREDAAKALQDMTRGAKTAQKWDTNSNPFKRSDTILLPIK